MLQLRSRESTLEAGEALVTIWREYSTLSRVSAVMLAISRERRVNLRLDAVPSERV
jgi:hypothetical protein